MAHVTDDERKEKERVVYDNAMLGWLEKEEAFTCGIEGTPGEAVKTTLRFPTWSTGKCQR